MGWSVTGLSVDCCVEAKWSGPVCLVDGLPADWYFAATLLSGPVRLVELLPVPGRSVTSLSADWSFSASLMSGTVCLAESEF